MYLPGSFRVAERDRLHALMEEQGFATLVTTTGDGAPEISHVPVLIDRERGPWGTIQGHLARANDHALLEGTSVVVFHGPHAYISPTWYGEGPLVPTWNYIAVHAHGTLRRIEDSQWLEHLLARLSDKYESHRSPPWTLGALEGHDVLREKLLGMIVGFELTIERLEGKWKLGQNHGRERREGVIAGLRREGDEQSRRVADLMEAELNGGESVR